MVFCEYILILGSDGRGIWMEVCEGVGGLVEFVVCSVGELVVIVYMLGMMGCFKGVMIMYGNLMLNVLMLYEFWGFELGDVFLYVLLIFYVYGFFVVLYMVFLNVFEICFLLCFDVGVVCDVLLYCFVMMGVLIFYVCLLEEECFDWELMNSVWFFVLGLVLFIEFIFEEFEC